MPCGRMVGAIVRFGKASWIITGYNTSSKEEKPKYDGAVLGVGWTLYVVVIIGAVIYANTGNRFKKSV